MDAITFISDNLIYSFFIGIVIGMIIVDFSYAIHLASKMKQLKLKESIRFDELRKEIKYTRETDVDVGNPKELNTSRSIRLAIITAK